MNQAIETRAEYLQWCKERALALLGQGSQTEIRQACASMMSDLSKNELTAGSVLVGTMLLLTASDRAAAEHFINGFN